MARCVGRDGHTESLARRRRKQLVALVGRSSAYVCRYARKICVRVLRYGCAGWHRYDARCVHCCDCHSAPGGQSAQQLGFAGASADAEAHKRARFAQGTALARSCGTCALLVIAIDSRARFPVSPSHSKRSSHCCAWALLASSLTRPAMPLPRQYTVLIRVAWAWASSFLVFLWHSCPSLGRARVQRCGACVVCSFGLSLLAYGTMRWWPVLFGSCAH